MILGTTLTGDPLHLDVDALIGSHLLIAANSGGGKSGAIRKLLEVTHGRVQHLILDAEDEFYTLRERYDYVIAGGDGGDTPATVANAAGLARASLQHGFSLIAQINDLGEDAAEFIAAFLDSLLTAPRALWRPLLVVIDEAQRFAPSAGSAEATGSMKGLLQRGRKRGFTAVLATTRVSELHPGVRGLCNNWLLGLVGQALDRRTAADQLGFRSNSAEAKGLQQLERRQFWGFGPALSRQPVLFRVGDVETTPVRPGQAKVATPPAPEALREILSGLASAPVDQVADASKAIGPDDRDAEIARLRAELTAEQERGQADYERGKAAGIAVCLTRARAALDALRVPDLLRNSQDTGVGDLHAGQEAGALPPSAPASAQSKPKSNSSTAKAVAKIDMSASPAALAIAELLDRVNPARLTWTQAAVLTGRKASGGNFNAARKWLRESGRLVEDGEFIRSAAPAPAGMTRAEALGLWRSVLTTPAPRMIDALARRALTKDELGTAIGAQPRGGNFNNGLAQLRRNGVAVEVGGKLQLARPLPGEAV